MVRLGDICKFQSGGTPSKSNPDYFDGTIPWITTIALNGNIINETNAIQWITPKAIQETAAKIVPEYSILVGTRVGIGKVAIKSVPMSTSQDIISLINIDTDHWDKKYLCELILSKNDYLLSQSRGATIKGIKIDTLADLIIPDVPLDEQRHIAATLDKVADLISKRRQQLDKLDELVKARFVEMFGDLTVNSFGWEFMPLSKLCDVRDGTHDSPEYLESGYPLLTSKNFTSGEVDFTDCNFISKEDFDKINQRSKVDIGDIVMPMIGTIGSPVIVNTERQFAIKNVALIKFDKSQISNIFVKQILNSDYFKQKIFSSNRGGTQKFIALGDIRKLPTPIVPVELQIRFANFVEQTEKVNSTISRSLEKLETLKKALMQEYFG